MVLESELNHVKFLKTSHKPVEEPIVEPVIEETIETSEPDVKKLKVKKTKRKIKSREVE